MENLLLDSICTVKRKLSLSLLCTECEGKMCQWVSIQWKTAIVLSKTAFTIAKGQGVQHDTARPMLYYTRPYFKEELRIYGFVWKEENWDIERMKKCYKKKDGHEERNFLLHSEQKSKLNWDRDLFI